MNSNLPDDDPTIVYNDSDYPSTDHSPFKENLDQTIEVQGLAHDVDRYLEIAAEADGPILEIGCGSGRVAIPLARAGHDVVGVDVSQGMLNLMKKKLEKEPKDLSERITLCLADATTMTLERTDFDLVLIPFNALLCIPDFDDQRKVIERIAAHVRHGGQLVIDLMSPHKLMPAGDPVPKPFFTRRNVWTGREYTRFAMMGALDAEQCQELKGWYDELREDGSVERRHYSLTWRPIYRYELVLMLEVAGFELTAIEGDHHGAPFDAQSPKMFVRAHRI